MTTFNTGNPIGSTDARDRLDNSENLDLAVNSLSQTFVDRLGVTRDTLEGIYQKSAYYRAGTFDAGYTLTNNRQTLAYGNIEYSWSGAFPKVVPAGSTPATSGGVGAGEWVDRSGDTLKQDLAQNTGAALVGYGPSLAYNEGTVGSEITRLRLAVAGYVTPQQYGALADGVADDTAAIQAAHDTGKMVFYPAGNYKITAPINITNQGQKVIGSGWGSSSGGSVCRVFATTDIKLYIVTAAWTHFEGFMFDNTSASMSAPHIHFSNDAFSSVDRCRFNAVQNFTATGGGILLDNGAGGIGGSVAVITNINISNGSIVVKRSDVHIKNSWLWANSRPYAVTASGAVGNLVIEGCDLLPPQTLVSGRKAAVYLTGALSAPRLLGCNFDGNSELPTGSGLLAENGVLNLLVSGCYGFGHDEDCIILDSIIAPVVIGNTFKNNNVAGNGAVDIRLRDTFAQSLEKPLIDGNAFTQTAAVAGTPGAAIRMDATTTRSGARIINNTIHQPGVGGGYTDIEILLDDGAFASDIAGSLRGNRGQRTRYEASGSSEYLNTDTFKTIPYGVTLAYAPRPDQVTLQVASSGAPPALRVNSASLPSASSAGVGLHGTFAGGAIHWKVAL